MTPLQPSPTDSSGPKAKTIWLVDDDETSLILAEAVLADAGFDVRTFTDSQQALAEAQSAPPQIIVVDVIMPKLDGFEFCTRLRQLPKGGDVPVLVTTSLDDKSSIERAYRCGATNFATKPINWEIEAHRLNYMLRAAEMAAEQKNLEAKLRHTEKMEAIGTLAGGIAHDFNNILTAISGYTELARLEPLPAAAQRSLDEVGRACRRAADLAGRILVFSRRHQQERLPLQLSLVIDEAIRLLRAGLPATVQFDIRLQGDLPLVLADATQIHQVVMNLCTNAAHAMKGRSDSRLEVRLERFTMDPAFARRYAGVEPGEYVCLAVSDNGHGMDRAILARIFEPFFTTKTPGQGTGLGLSVVHGIVKEHAGLITVESQPAQGTVFRLYFPALAGESAAVDAKPAEMPRGRQQRIMVVDDEPPIADLLGQMLRQLGYVVDVNTDSRAAYQAVVTDAADYDAILTDLTMPGMTGIELIERVMLHKRSARFVLLSGFVSSANTAKLREAGFREVLSKPPTMAGLAQAMGRVLGP